MADVKWIKIATNIFDNRKIRQIECLPDGDAIIVIWIKLLCLAGNINDDGIVYFTKDIPYTEQMLATQFNRSLSTVQLAIKTFEQFGMVEVIDNILRVSNWEKYQSIERLTEIREYNRIAQQKSREKRKQLSDVNDMSMICQSCHEIDIDKELDIDKNTRVLDKSRSKRFTPPSVDEVKAYCQERNNGIDAAHFVDYYTANDWKVGKNRMKDWQAAVRTWEKNGFNKTSDKRIDYTNPDIYKGIKESEGFLDGVL